MRETMPASLSHLVKPLFVSCLALFSKFPATVEERKKCIKSHFEDEELDEDEATEVSDDDLDDEEDGVVDEEKEAKYIALLKKHAAERAAAGDDDSDFDEDEDEWGVPLIEEDPYFFTVLDKIDPYKVFNEVMQGVEVEGWGLGEAECMVLKEVRTTVMVPFGYQEDGTFAKV